MQDKINEIKSQGKLVNSSYYSNSLSNKLIVDPAESLNNDITNNNVTVVNDSIKISCCVFSQDDSYLAWTCGYGLIKILNYKKYLKLTNRSKPMARKKSSENLINNKKLHKNNFKTQGSSQSRHYSENEEDEDDEYENNGDLIKEIDCGENVHSLEFGSSKSYVKHDRYLHTNRPSLYRRFNLINDTEYLLLAVGVASGRICIYDVINNFKFMFCLFDHKSIVCDLKFTKDSTLQLASVSRDETVKLWNMCDDGNMYKTLKGHMGWVYGCDWSPTASLLCTVGSNREAFIWNTTNFNLVHKLNGHLHDVVTCEFSPDGALVATGSHDTKVLLWDPYTGQLIRQFLHLVPAPSFIYAGGYNGAYVRGLRFSSNGDHIVSICDDK